MYYIYELHMETGVPTYAEPVKEIVLLDVNDYCYGSSRKIQ